MLDPQNNLTFAEIYMLDERRFASEPVKALLFSNRITKRFRQAGIITIKDLLELSPATLMKIEGFGVGCLEEIDQKLSKLEDIRQKTATEIPNLSVPLIEEAPLSELDTITIGDKYGMNPDDYVDVETASIPFSARVSNVLQRNQITTIAQLLQQTEKQLSSLRNFGRICTEEIDARLAELREEKKPKARIFTPDESRSMAKGDFSFLNGVDLIDSDNNYIKRCIEAQEVLGNELAFACIGSPEKIRPVLDMLHEFGQRIMWQRELKAALKDVPVHRKNNQAVAYINTFTRHESEREILLELYPAPNAPLSAIENSNILNLFSFSLAMRFLAWCKYDIQNDVTQKILSCFKNNRCINPDLLVKSLRNRLRIISMAEEKQTQIHKIVSEIKENDHFVVYCVIMKNAG